MTTDSAGQTEIAAVDNATGGAAETVGATTTVVDEEARSYLGSSYLFLLCSHPNQID